MNSAPRRMNWEATPASTITRYSAACTTFLVVTTRHADTSITAAMMPKKMFCATKRSSPSEFAWASRDAIIGAPHSSRDLLDLGLAAGLVGLEVGHGLEPLGEALLVVEQIGDAELAELVLGAPEQGVERADLDADAAEHAKREVDVEAVERVFNEPPAT